MGRLALGVKNVDLGGVSAGTHRRATAIRRPLPLHAADEFDSIRVLAGRYGNACWLGRDHRAISNHVDSACKYLVTGLAVNDITVKGNLKLEHVVFGRIQWAKAGWSDRSHEGNDGSHWLQVDILDAQKNDDLVNDGLHDL